MENAVPISGLQTSPEPSEIGQSHLLKPAKPTSEPLLALLKNMILYQSLKIHRVHVATFHHTVNCSVEWWEAQTGERDIGGEKVWKEGEVKKYKTEYEDNHKKNGIKC